MVFEFDELMEGSVGVVDDSELHEDLISLIKSDKVKIYGYEFDGEWLDVQMKVSKND